jgi:ferritin-like protein/TAT (twin-arginine translocation) pathway-exported protein
MDDKRLFGGEPVLRFSAERDRRNFLKWTAVVGVGGTLAISMRDGSGSAQGGNRDVDILNYILTLEYLEADFYSRGMDAGILSGRDQELIEPIAAHEKEHVALISSTIQDLGADPIDEPRIDYPGGTFPGGTTSSTPHTRSSRSKSRPIRDKSPSGRTPLCWGPRHPSPGRSRVMPRSWPIS